MTKKTNFDIHSTNLHSVSFGRKFNSQLIEGLQESLQLRTVTCRRPNSREYGNDARHWCILNLTLSGWSGQTNHCLSHFIKEQNGPLLIIAALRSILVLTSSQVISQRLTVDAKCWQAFTATTAPHYWAATALFHLCKSFIISSTMFATALTGPPCSFLLEVFDI